MSYKPTPSRSRKPRATTVVADAVAIARAVDAMVALSGGALDKGAALDAFARAVAGPRHDWGFLKNRPSGAFVQPGLQKPAPAQEPVAQKTPSRTAWALVFDEDATWAPRAPELFASKAAALQAARACEPWWRNVDHPTEAVISGLERDGRYVFQPGEDDPEFHDTDRASIEIMELTISGDTEQDAATPGAPQTAGDGASTSGGEKAIRNAAIDAFGLVAQTSIDALGLIEEHGLSPEAIDKAIRIAVETYLAEHPDAKTANPERDIIDGDRWGMLIEALETDLPPQADDQDDEADAPSATKAVVGASAPWIVETTADVRLTRAANHLAEDDDAFEPMWGNYDVQEMAPVDDARIDWRARLLRRDTFIATSQRDAIVQARALDDADPVLDDRGWVIEDVAFNHEASLR